METRQYISGAAIHDPNSAHLQIALLQVCLCARPFPSVPDICQKLLRIRTLVHWRTQTNRNLSRYEDLVHHTQNPKL